MKISDLLKKEFIIPAMKGTTKEEVIDELLDLFKNDPRVHDFEKVRMSVFEREKIMSTGVGKGFALPHGKTEAVTEILCAFGRTAEPIDYQALDSQPVNLLFLIIGKDNVVSLNIKLLSRISRMMSKDDFRKLLTEAQTAEELAEVFEKEEQEYFDL